MWSGFLVPPCLRFPEPPYDPGRSVFPNPVRGRSEIILSPDRPSFVQRQLKLWSAYTRESRSLSRRMATNLGSGFIPGVTRTLLNEQVALRYPQALRERSAASPSSLLRPDVPVPMPLINYAFWLVDESSQFGPPTAGHRDLPDVISANLSLDAWTSTPAALVVRIPVSSHETSAFPTLGTGRRSATSRTATSARARFRGCSHSLRFRPPHLLATQVAPTDSVTILNGSRGFYV